MANFENLNEVLASRPKMIHISCHGGYKDLKDSKKFFLAFEDAERLCVLKKLDED